MRFPESIYTPLCALVFLAGGLGLPRTADAAPGVSAPRIGAVTARLVEEATEAETRPRPVGRRIVKFDDYRQLRRSEVYAVAWDPGSVRVPKGSVLVFEYLQERSRKSQQLRITYPFEVAVPRRAEFVIAPADLKRGGRVRAWRVSLVHGQRLLAQKRTTNWKNARQG